MIVSRVLRSSKRPFRPSPGFRPAGGFSLAELVVILSLVLAMALLTVPPLLSTAATTRTRLAAAEVAVTLRLARAEAVRRGEKVGVKFLVEGDRIRWALHRDGDGDGLRSDDIRTGRDPALAPARGFRHLGRTVGFGFPPGEPPRDPGDPRRRLDRLDDPIRFNRSDIASFGSLGTSTPGSVYLSDGLHALAVVRLFGHTGKVKVLLYDFDDEEWH